MALALKLFNVALYEPAGIKPALRIADSILSDLEAKVNAPLRGALVPELVRLGLMPRGASLEDYAAGGPEVPDEAAQKAGLAEEGLFAVNAAVYKAVGGIPASVGRFTELCARLSPRGVQIVFLNTAGQSSAEERDQLVKLLEGTPALYDSTWVVTDSLRDPIPAELRALVEKRLQGASPSVAKRTAATVGCPFVVPIGDSIVMRAEGESVAFMLARLKHLRKWG